MFSSKPVYLNLMMPPHNIIKYLYIATNTTMALKSIDDDNDHE